MELLENLRVEEKTDIGNERENNEDRSLVLDSREPNYPVEKLGVVLAVADGMGGHVAGETASQTACDVLREFFLRQEVTTGEGDARSVYKPLETLHNAVVEANRRIFDLAQNNTEFEGMGTTLTALVLLEGKGFWVHVGDSRIYRVRGGKLDRLTKDQTEVQALIDMGRLAAERAATHPWRHILTQAVGTEEELEEIEKGEVDLEAGDLFLLCSDGLHDMLKDEEIAEILCGSTDPSILCGHLIDKALEHGGEDNVTVILAYLVAKEEKVLKEALKPSITPVAAAE